MIGMEPAIKPAAERTKTGVIAVYATPRTLSSQRYHQLKQEYAQNITVLEPDCSDWAMMIESDSLDRDKIAETTENVIKEGADQIVLGCTHYHWIEEIIKNISSGRAEIIQPEKPVIAQLKRVLLQLP
jgi:glutamate racemase